MVDFSTSRNLVLSAGRSGSLTFKANVPRLRHHTNHSPPSLLVRHEPPRSARLSQPYHKDLVLKVLPHGEDGRLALGPFTGTHDQPGATRHHEEFGVPEGNCRRFLPILTPASRLESRQPKYSLLWLRYHGQVQSLGRSPLTPCEAA